MAHTTNKRESDIGYDDFTVNWKAVNSGNVKQSYEKGSVVYFVSKCNNTYNVDYGIVVDCYDDYVCLQLIAFPDYRLVNGIPYKDFPFVTEWRKIPKDFNPAIAKDYVCEIKDDRYYHGCYVDISNPQEILEMYHAGKLVNVQDIEHTTIQCDFDAKYGYRLRKGCDGRWDGDGYYTDCGNDPHRKYQERALAYRHKTSAAYVGLRYAQCFDTFEGAEENVNWFESMVAEQQEMTEREFAMRQIKYDIDKSFSPEDRQKAIEFFDNIEGLENIESCYGVNCIQWRKLGAKKWNTYPKEDE